MVWTAGDSPLYKCVERFNNTQKAESCDETPKACVETKERCCGTSSETLIKPEKTQCDNSPGKCCAKEVESCASAQENPQKHNCGTGRKQISSCPKDPRNAPFPGNLIQKLTSDHDFMLIAALIVLLLHEKADMKLIAALAFIILT